MMKRATVKRILKDVEMFLELSGETEPLVTSNYSDLFNKTDEDIRVNLKVYEYHWSLGIARRSGARVGKFNIINRGYPIKVQLLFGDSETPFRIKEIATSLKAPKPSKESKTFFDNFKTGFNAVKPLVDVIADLPIFEGPLKTIMGVISKLNMDSLQPQTSPWHVKFITTALKEEGIEWCISKKAYKDLGNRFTGSVAVVFIECQSNMPSAKKAETEKPEDSKFKIVGKAIIKVKKRLGSQFVFLPKDESAEGIACSNVQGDGYEPLELEIKPIRPESGN